MQIIYGVVAIFVIYFNHKSQLFSLANKLYYFESKEDKILNNEDESPTKKNKQSQETEANKNS